MARIVFMGTPEFAVPSLEKLIATQDVVGVVTQPDRPSGRGRREQAPPVKVVAQDAEIPVYQPKSLRLKEAAEPIHGWQPDLIVVAAFGQILRPHILYLPPHGCLNVHASLLPRWRGAAPIQHAILAGDQKIGISLMKMDEGLDTGPVYIQESMVIHPDDTAESLHDRLAKLGAAMIGRYLDDILDGRLLAHPQDDDSSTYAPMISKEQGNIDWTVQAEFIDRQIRAMTPWPSAYTTWQGKRLKVLAAEPVEGDDLPSGLNGEVIFNNQDEIVVLAGKGGLKLFKVQLSGKRATAIDDFLRGHPQFVGSTLPS